LQRGASCDRSRIRRASAGAAPEKVEDGRGRPLGRSFGIKLWPTLVFLRDGQERARVVRPDRTDEIAAGLAGIADGDDGASA